MKKIGLFYGTETEKTASVAKKIQDALGKETEIEIVPVEKAWKEDFEAFTNLIVGTSTWFDGELPSYWDELIPELETVNFKNKKIAIFGLGDQIKYPDNFVDGIGILAELFESYGASIIGFTSPKDYTFTQSKALRNGQFLGLAVDLENQPEKTDQRIKYWIEQLIMQINI